MRLILTEHAIDRFCERVQSMAGDAARVLLEARLPTAKPLRKRTRDGQRRFALADPPCVLIARQQGSECIVVTILGVGEVEEDPTPPAPDHALGAALWLLKYHLQRPGPEMPPADLVPAVERLAVAVDRRPDLSSGRVAPLLRGFEILAAAAEAPRQKRKLELLRDGLREVVGDMPRADSLDAEHLWARVARMAREEAAAASLQERGAWEATARVWEEGLKVIRRAG